MTSASSPETKSHYAGADSPKQILPVLRPTHDDQTLFESKLTGGGLPVGQDQDDFRLLVEAVSDYAVYMLTPEGIVSSWNKGAERNKGYTSAEAIGLHFSTFYTPEDRIAGAPLRALRMAANSKFEAYGWRSAQGRQSVLGACGDRRNSQCRRASDRICQSYL